MKRSVLNKEWLNCAAISGYTLIEVLLALFIFSIISVITVTSISNVFILREVQSKHVKRMQELQVAMSIMERDVQQIIKRPVVNSSGREEAALIYSKQQGVVRVDFTRAGYVNPQAEKKRSTLQRLSYYLEKDKLIRANKNFLENEREDIFYPRVLLNQVKDISWRFMGSDKKFYDIWPPVAQLQNKLPRAIEVSVNLEHWGILRRLFIIAEHDFAITVQQPTAKQKPAS